MNKMMRHVALAILRLTFLACVAPALFAASGDGLEAFGFNTTIEELDQLLAFQNSIRLEPVEKVLADWSGRLENLQVRELKKSENRYAYAIDAIHGRQIIAIRGTANLVNALLDLEFWRDTSPLLGIRLHHGFELAASLVLEDVTQFLRADMPILVCGHSLGAAEAIIVGMMLSKEGYKVEKIVASGPPKVTDAEGWRAYANLPVLRITAAFDPVPFLPPASFYRAAPLEQGGPLFMLLDGSNVTIAPSSFYDTMGRTFKEVKMLSEHFDVVDHRVWTYWDRVKEKRSGLAFVPFEAWESFAKPRK